jgi:hypothetical protein
MSARPRRVELNTSLRLSGDQLGDSSLRGCSITGKLTSPVGSINQMSNWASSRVW